MDVGQCRPLYIIYLNAYDLACNEAVDGLVIYYIILQQYIHVHVQSYMHIHVHKHFSTSFPLVDRMATGGRWDSVLYVSYHSSFWLY